jgi:hypothetical protein
MISHPPQGLTAGDGVGMGCNNGVHDGTIYEKQEGQ